MMIFLIKVNFKNKIQIINSSIQLVKGHIFPTNTSHYFKHHLCEGEKILFMIYYLHSIDNVIINILENDSFVNIQKI